MNSCRYAPMFALTSALTATIRPSRVDATVMSVTTSRAWIVDHERLRALLRVHVQAAPRRRQGDDKHLLCVHVAFGSETATDVRRDHPHLGLPESEHLRHVQAQEVGDLGRRPHRHVPGVVPGTDDRAGLHRARNEARLHVPPGHDDIRARDRFFDTIGLEAPDVALVGPELGMHERGTRLERLENSAHARQRAPLDLDQLGGVDRVRATLGNDDRDAVAESIWTAVTASG